MLLSTLLTKVATKFQKMLGITSYFEYQVTNIMEISSKKFKSIGFALMDGPFFSFLPMGTKKK